jgi:two-component system response regulator GlrR
LPVTPVPAALPPVVAVPRILVVDDDESLLTLIAMRLDASGFQTVTARTAVEALGRLQAMRPQLAIVDLRLQPERIAAIVPGSAVPDGADIAADDEAEDENSNGLALARRMRQIDPLLPVIILTAHGSIPDAVAATREGLAAFLTKPFDGRALVEEVKRHIAQRAPEGPADGWRAQIVTRNHAMLALIDEIARIARHDATVLIVGPSGSGKELVARAIHAASPRAARPFVGINCAALPEQLLESELFGHVRGAFTGAVAEHPGLLRSAQGGSVLLDEIGDMPLSLQAKLLRVLQERKVRPVGGTREVEVDVRVIAATHRDLAQSLKAGSFREDLFYRLNVVRLAVPALDARREDIPLLAQHFLGLLSARYRSPARSFAPEALERLTHAPWPGNVRQLFNVIEQCVVIADGPIISATLIERALSASPAGGESQRGILPLAEARAQFEREYLVQLLKLTGGNVSQAARIARRNRTEFYRLIERHGLHSDLFR